MTVMTTSGGKPAMVAKDSQRDTMHTPVKHKQQPAIQPHDLLAGYYVSTFANPIQILHTLQNNFRNSAFSKISSAKLSI